MKNNYDSKQKIGRWENSHIWISAVIWIVLFGGSFGLLFYMMSWIAWQ